jgi:hypothetical protein
MRLSNFEMPSDRSMPLSKKFSNWNGKN